MRPCGTSHKRTTFRLTLSLACARVIARFRTDLTSRSVRVLGSSLLSQPSVDVVGREIAELPGTERGDYVRVGQYRALHNCGNVATAEPEGEPVV